MKNKVKQSTYVSYRGYIENHLAPAFPTLKLKDLTTKLLQDFYNYKQNTQKLSPKTILNLHRCLHKAMNQAVLEHYIDFNPCDAVSLPRNEKPQVEVLTREEQQKLIYTSYKYRYGIFIRLTLATGIRLGELLGLRWEDIDFGKRMLSIRRTINRLPKVDYNGMGNSTEIVIQEPKRKTLSALSLDFQYRKRVTTVEKCTAERCHDSWCSLSGFRLSGDQPIWRIPGTQNIQGCLR